MMIRKEQNRMMRQIMIYSLVNNDDSKFFKYDLMIHITTISL